MRRARLLARSPSDSRITAMSTHLAEGLLAVMWLDRCRQTQLLSEAGANRDEVAHTLLASFIVDQRWGVGSGAVGDEGDLQIEGILNFDPSGWRADFDHAHVIEQGIFANLVRDAERGAWHHIDYYMRRAEFFGGLPPGTLRRLPEGSRMR